MTTEPRKDDKPLDQGGHAGEGGGHAGQHSGGMGGEHGGDLHDAGSAQSGMTGRGGMGGNDSGAHQSGRSARQGGNLGNRQDDEASLRDIAEVQQSAQREGMGHHRRGGRGNEQALDAAADVDDLGTHASAAGKVRGQE